VVRSLDYKRHAAVDVLLMTGFVFTGAPIEAASLADLDIQPPVMPEAAA
jgi:hypothetical protein